MKKGKGTKTAILFLATVLLTSCATPVTTPYRAQHTEPNWTWDLMEDAITNPEIQRAYAKFNEESTNKALRAEAFAGMAVAALRKPAAIGINPAQRASMALIYSEKALLADPNSERVHYARGLALVAAGNYDQAEAFHQATAYANPPNCDYRILGADLAVARKSIKGSLHEINRALSCNIGRYDRYMLNMYAARAYNENGDHPRAISAYEEAISINRHDIRLQTEYAATLLTMGSLKKAMEEAHKALAMQDNRATQRLLSDIHMATGRQLEEASQYNLAATEYSKAAARDATNQQAYRALMLINANRLNTCNSALEYAEHILQSQPSDKEAAEIKRRCPTPGITTSLKATQ